MAAHQRADEAQRPARVTKACRSCAASKVKCEESRPCNRCQQRGDECVDVLPDQQPSHPASVPASTEMEPESGLNFASQAGLGPSSVNNDHFQAMAGLEGLQDEPPSPSFFENIMVPYDDFAGPQAAELPPDIFTIMPEQDDWMASLDLFGGEFVPTFESALEHDAAAMEGPSPIVSVTGAESTGSGAHSSATVRSNIFSRSPQ